MIGAVDIGGTKIGVGMVSEAGRVLARTECPTAPERGLADGLARIITMLRDTAARAGEELGGIGVGCTGPVHPLAGTIGDVEFLPGWEGAHLVAELSGVFDIPVAIENDADAAALGEAAWGAGRGARSFVYVTVGTGIGGGLVFGGQLYRGVDGAHPEIGHHVIDPSGPACFCGAHGCWESLASGPALARWMSDDTPADRVPGAGPLCPGRRLRSTASEAASWQSGQGAPPRPRSVQRAAGGPVMGASHDARSICEAAERGEPRALAAVAREGYYLGLGLANLITLFAPEVIALGGGLMRSRHLFWEPIRETIQATCGLVPFEKVRLVSAALGPDTALVGAARAWFHRYRPA